MNNNIRHLISLLDDEDEQTVASVMVELLRNPDDLEVILQEAQDNDNTLIRRRVHQLQSVLQSRRIRRDLAAFIRSDSPDLLEGLIALHYQWFDNDPPDTGLDAWKTLVNSAAGTEIHTLEQLGTFMNSATFKVADNDFPEAEEFCIGEVLEEHCGSDVILAAIALHIGRFAGLSLELVTNDEAFGVMDDSGNVLFPDPGWLVRLAGSMEKIRIWTAPEILRYVTSLLFGCAVSSDSFRYIGSLGVCLGLHNLSMLPFPYATHTAHTPCD